MNTINPYAAVGSGADPEPGPTYRRPKTYLDAAVIGLMQSFIAPLYFFIVRSFLFGGRGSASIFNELREFLPISIVGIALGISLALFIPQSVSRLLCNRPYLVTSVVTSLLYSAYFSAVGYGYLRGSIALPIGTLSLITFVPALIVATSVMLHIACRPKRTE